MKFSDKLKKLRKENNITQEQLAEKLYVTRSAISKWETDNGYPAIDSLKMLSNVFDISIDELISDEDVENQRLLEKSRARKMYYLAIICLIATTVFTILCYYLKIKLLSIGSIATLIGYIVFGLLSKPKYKRIEAKKLIAPYLISRAVILAIVIIAMITMIKNIAS